MNSENELKIDTDLTVIETPDLRSIMLEYDLNVKYTFVIITLQTLSRRPDHIVIQRSLHTSLKQHLLLIFA